MPRKVLIETSDFPYHITNRSNNREFFPLPVKDIWSIFIEQLSTIKKLYGCRIHAFVLMSNHYHLILSTPQKNLSLIMTHFHREVARQANRKSQRTNHFFGGRYKWCLITEENYYWNAIRYVFQNPKRAGITNDVYQYPFSSLKNDKNCIWELVDFFNSPYTSIELNYHWVNDLPNNQINEAISKGLRRREFKVPKNKNRKPIAELVFDKRVMLRN